MTALRNREGFAILTTLLAIAIVTALTLTTLLRIDQDAQISRTETVALRAFAAAETALWETLTRIDTHGLRVEPLGTVIVSKIIRGDITINVTVTKIDTAIVWIVADATVRQGRDQARHRLGLNATMSADTMDSRLYPVPDRGWVELF